ncbi:MAG TPA: dihydrodipicolinate synthetase [Bacteroidales bacterium]|nr:dihydrodipicolinate synthetase [Bacteroidales bacterium]HBH85812.1 dihydrodipicolinate synthetase [Bacteroidales bacterium]HBQ83604.1 dihydrodipicolinate synthetase [Bacteroidales bacterium]HCU20686.1 dihydrodipicolinate synthetase [Bacteroidales bacterium]
MKKFKRFEGLVAAPFTAMDKGGNVNTELVPEYYNFLKKNGVVGAFINGSTGEGVSLTQKEKQLHVEKWADCFKKDGSVCVINLVGGTSYKECIDNAVISFEAGISAIAVLAPYYFKPAGEDYLAEFVAMVGESVPKMAIYFYHIPVLTGVNFPMINFLKKISGMLPNFVGIKYTHEDFMDFLSCLNYDKGAYEMLWGRDENLLAALALGARGAVGSTYNYAAPLYSKLIKAYDEDNMAEARRLQQLSINMITLLGKYGGMGTGKAFMKYIGLDCGEFRLPVKNVDQKTYSLFVEEVRALDIDYLFSVK